jgi:hypothetical protein
MPEDRRQLSKPPVVELRASELQRLEALVAEIPDTRIGRIRVPSAEELDIVRRYWRVKTVDGLARALGVAEGTLRRWARENGLK